MPSVPIATEAAVNASNSVVFCERVYHEPDTDELQASLESMGHHQGAGHIGNGRSTGRRAWEYTMPGALSPGGPGPNAAEQTLIPDNIKKARFNLYLVLYDGSFGVHNPDYILDAFGRRPRLG